MGIALVCIGKLKERWQREGCAEYLKRLTRYAPVEIIELDDQREPEKRVEALEKQVLDKEGTEILRRIRAQDRVVALCVRGVRLDSLGFAARMKDWAASGERIVFVIGGSLGLSEAVEKRADERLSFSDMTYPHGLMRVILLEQIYRAARINAGERYHK